MKGRQVWSEGRVALDRADHAVAAAAALTELEPGDSDHLDAGLAQRRVDAGVPLIGHHHAGLARDDVVAVVPLLAPGLEEAPSGLDHPHRDYPHAAAH